MFQSKVLLSYVIQDTKTDTYSYPIFVEDLPALEQHLEVCCMTGHFKHNPEQFALFFHGIYDPEEAKYIQEEDKKFVSTLTPYAKYKEQA